MHEILLYYMHKAFISLLLKTLIEKVTEIKIRRKLVHITVFYINLCNHTASLLNIIKFINYREMNMLHHVIYDLQPLKIKTYEETFMMQYFNNNTYMVLQCTRIPCNAILRKKIL